MKRSAGTGLAMALALAIFAGQAAGQQAGKQPPASPAAPAEPVAPYEPQLLRLSEIMGSLAYLRDLCGQRDGDSWRARMASLIEAESSSPARRERLAGAYNKGFRGFEATYRTCTPNAATLIQRYLDEGGKIARDVTGRFGG